MVLVGVGLAELVELEMILTVVKVVMVQIIRAQVVVEKVLALTKMVITEPKVIMVTVVEVLQEDVQEEMAGTVPKRRIPMEILVKPQEEEVVVEMVMAETVLVALAVMVKLF